MRSVKVATWNVNGIRKRSTEVLSWIDREEPDVVCLQETKAALDQIPDHILDVAGYHCHWHGHKGYSGVALMLRRKTFGDTPTFIHPRFDMETRIVVAEVGPIVFGSVYGPNGGKDYPAKIEFWKELVLWAGELHHDGKHLVLAGDFNIARLPIDVHPALRKPMIGQSPEERALFEQFLSYGLVDVARRVDPDNDRLFTWWAPWRNMRERNIGWRLDYVAASSALVDEHVHCVAYRDVGTSDHGPVIAHLRDTPLVA
jgi:exodeoxyribonuclease-3